MPDDVDDMDVGEYYKLLCAKNANLAVKDELLKQLKKMIEWTQDQLKVSL